MEPDNKPVNVPKINDPSAQAQSGQASIGSPTANIPIPDEAADSDLIEKEWVERAKQIVEHTKSDPFEQQRAVSQMKADYLKKRYDKDIDSPSG